MTHNINFTKKELKQLIDISLDTLSKLIAEKTENTYILVKKEMVQDINKRLFDNILHITKISDSAFDSWENIIKGNKEVLKRWK